MQSGGGIKTFATRRPGQYVVTAVSTVTLLLTFVYLGPNLATIAFLLFGLLIPIYLGWKIPRQLAIAGLAALLIAAPVATLFETQMLRTPAPLSTSSDQLPWGAGGPVLANASVHPYLGNPAGIYNFSVDLQPQFLPPHTSGLLWLSLNVSTCPTATGPTDQFCSGGYPYHSQNITFGSNGTLQLQSITLGQQLNGSNIWYWQMSTGYRNSTGSVTPIFLYPLNGYATIEGPVTGTFASTYGIVVVPVFLAMFSECALVFFVLLLVYAFLKQRERRRKDREAAERAASGAPPTPGTDAATPPVAPAKTPATQERSCPNCKAVVYPNESACWKCGASLTPAADAPLPSGR